MASQIRTIRRHFDHLRLLAQPKKRRGITAFGYQNDRAIRSTHVFTRNNNGAMTATITQAPTLEIAQYRRANGQKIPYDEADGASKRVLN